MRKIKRALITGITGQDGSYLSEFLLKKNYKVYGIVRRVALEDETHRLWRIKHLLKKITIKSASLESYASIVKIIQKIKPDEIYHLGAQSYVSYSFEDEFSTLNTNINGTHHILSAIKDFSPKSKFYFAGSSEMFGKVQKNRQDEKTRFYPRSAYGISKVAGFELTRNYREAYKIFACTGILFNHESPRRGFEFVTRKISSSVAKIKLGKQKHLQLGNIEAKRDWGHAKDYVKAMWSMLQQKKPSDFVIGTGEMHSVKEFAKLAFSIVGLDYRKYVKFNKSLLRPTEVETLRANYNKANKILKWKPTVKFNQLVKEMVEEDLKFFR
jgi:GDPmannose 4,6-dehydratase|tara:strand:- start:229 stop:1206 length:978 start_codon:yes stop_codon:yes gene_type:complete